MATGGGIVQTRLMTIMFIDVQGFTKRTANQTLEETQVFIEETRSFVKEHLEKWNGKLIKTIGDGFLGSFEAPTAAIQAALEIQRKLEARNANILNPENFVRFRIGINTGEIAVDENGDVFGDPVNIAARIESFCEPNEVFISEATYLAINRNQFQIKDLGPQMFKNATREIRIYKILRHGPELGGASTETAPKPMDKQRPMGATASTATRPSPATVKLICGILGFLLIAFLFRVVLKKLMHRPASSGKTASDTVSLPPVMPLPGVKVGQTPLLVPAPPPNATAAATTNTAEEDDLPDEVDLAGEFSDETSNVTTKKPRRIGFLKAFTGGLKDRQRINQLVKQGKIDEATEYCEKRYREMKSAGIMPPPNAFVGLAHLYKMAKQYEKAVDSLERGVRAYPDNKHLQKILMEARANLAKFKGQ